MQRSGLYPGALQRANYIAASADAVHATGMHVPFLEQTKISHHQPLVFG
jgi:hypothetical protein